MSSRPTPIASRADKRSRSSKTMPDMVAIAVRLGLYLDLMLLFGLPMFGLYTLRGTERESGSVLRFRSVLASIALAGIGLSILGMMVLAASMGGVSVDQVDRATINMVISGTSIGTIWQVRVAALLLVLYFSIVGWRRPAFALGSLSVTAAIALATLAWTGHGAADEGLLGWVHLGADITHLLAAGIWVGEVCRSKFNKCILGPWIGTLWCVRVAALLLVLYFSIVGWRRPAFALGSLSVTAAIALATLAWTGHGAADEGLLGWVHLGADITHLLAAGIWVGALAALCLLIFRPADRMAVDHIHLSQDRKSTRLNSSH